MRPAREQVFLEMAVSMAKRSTCLRRAVGCVLVNARGHVLATGYNGVAAGMPHCNEQTSGVVSPLEENVRGLNYQPVYSNACSGAIAQSGQNLEGCEAIHAEQNALLQCGDVHAIETCYVTASPCIHCIKLLLNTGCDRIVFISKYDDKALELWKRAGKVYDQYAFQASFSNEI